MALTVGQFPLLTSYFAKYGVTLTVADLITAAEIEYSTNEDAAKAKVNVDAYQALLIEVAGNANYELGPLVSDESSNDKVVEVFQDLLNDAQAALALATSTVPKGRAFSSVITPYS